MIAIGALGGSGTRAVAQVFLEAGIYMGDDLNRANDNLIFTRLFKDPNWYKSSTERNILRRLDIFKRYMSHDSLTPAEFIEICRTASSNPTFPSDIKFYVRMMGKIFHRKMYIQQWGWKEPNTQIYINHLMEFSNEVKYIHVIRHGLDMAFSKNKQQLKYWGWKFNVHCSGSENEMELSTKQLEYWIRTNQYVLEICSKYPERCMIIYHDDFCKDPVSQVDRMMAFAGIKTDKQTLENLYKIPRNTGSNHRYKKYDINMFSPEQLEQVEALGCRIN